MSKIIIDTDKNIAFDPDSFPLKNLHALSYLKEGLFQLASVIRNAEIQKRKSGIPVTFEAFMFKREDQFFTCIFHWFSISIVNYLRLVSLIDVMNKNNWGSEDISKPENIKTIKEYCSKYVEETIPEIHLWRNKISAHFAITDPRQADNLATLEFSIMLQLTYFNPYYVVSGLNWGSKGTTSDIPKWALTKIYDELTPRFWPTYKINPLS
jgi:hypothetical protein